MKDMLTLAEQVLGHAYAKYSDFPVAAVFRGDDGNLYAGVNVENAAYPATLCAESSALGAMITAGAARIIEVLILVPNKTLCPPCGSCRQRIYEFAEGDIDIHLCTTEGKQKTLPIAAFFPLPFGSENLN